MNKLSILVPCFNNEKTLEMCLVAIRKSSYKNYELIVIDDGSTDLSCTIAKKYADIYIRHESQKGRLTARYNGIQKAKGEVIVNIDSDVVIKKNTLFIIASIFSNDKSIDAVTGILSKENLNTNFASIYKNLYMHYYFSQLPQTITFLYGSLYAIRKSSFLQKTKRTAKIADDTENGQALKLENKNIQLLKSLEVTHLKKYMFMSLIQNDFIIPFEWAKIFLTYKGWKQLGKNGTGFAHASKGQITSLFLAPLIVISLIAAFIFPSIFLLSIFLISFWARINSKFFSFLFQEKGFIFATRSIVFTFLDHIIMMTGVVWGTIAYILHKH